MKTIIETATEAGNFKTLVSAIGAAHLTETLNGKGPFTVFAPTDEAFAHIPAADLEALLKDTGKLKAVLNYHVVQGKREAKGIKSGELETVQGMSVSAVVKDGKVKIDGAAVTKADVQASNGVIHAIDKVLLPKGTTLSRAA